jgi:hypothetical protein
MISAKKSISAVAALAASAFIAGCGNSCDKNAVAEQDNAGAEKLTTQLFDAIRSKNVAELNELLTPNFQLQRGTGVTVTKAQYTAKVPTITDFSVNSVSGTRYGNTFVVTLKENAHIKTATAEFTLVNEPQLFTWVKLGGKWRLASSGNFARPKP